MVKLARPEISQPSSNQTAPAQHRIDGPIRVMLISDQVDFGKSLQLQLTASGCDTIWAATGKEAIEAAGAFSPEAVLLDMGLRVGGPYAVAVQIDQVNSEKNRRLISLSDGEPSESDIVRGLNANVNSFVSKPVDFERMLGLLNIAWHACHDDE